MLDYNKLRTFSVVAEELNVSRAANRLGRTQSAISQQLKALEDELDLLLFSRKGARLSLTTEGSRIFSLAQESFSHIDQNINVIKGTTQSLEGAIRIGITADHCNDLLPNLLSDFLKEFPKVRFDIHQLEDRKTESGLLDNSLDFGFITMFKERELFERLPILTFHEYLYASKKYLSRKKISDPNNITIENLLNLDIIDYNDDMPCLLTWINKNRSNWSRKLLEKKPAYTVHNHETRKRFVLADLGTSMVRDYMVEDEYKSKQVVRILPDFKSLKVTVDFAVRKRINLTPLQHYFLEFIRNRKL